MLCGKKNDSLWALAKYFGNMAIKSLMYTCFGKWKVINCQRSNFHQHIMIYEFSTNWRIGQEE